MVGTDFRVRLHRVGGSGVRVMLRSGNAVSIMVVTFISVNITTCYPHLRKWE